MRGGGFRCRRQTQISAVFRVRHQHVFGKHRNQSLAAEVGEWGCFIYTKLGLGHCTAVLGPEAVKGHP